MPLRGAPAEVFQALKLSRWETPFHVGDLLRRKRQLSAAADVIMLPQHAGNKVGERWMRSQVVLTFERPRELRGYEAEQAARMLRTVAS